MKDVIELGLLAENIETVNECFKWDYQSMQVLGAFIATSQGRRLDAERVMAAKQIMKERHGMFSDLRGHLELPIVIKMALSDDPEGYLYGVEQTYELLSSSFVLGNESRLLTALVIHDDVLPQNRPEACMRTMEVYKAFREEHRFLTDQDDLPYAAMVALRNQMISEQIDDVEICYQLLNSRFFLSQNEIQTVSHVLSLSNQPSEDKAAAFMEMFETFKLYKIPLRGTKMPILAVLANSGIPADVAASKTAQTLEDLKEIKQFRGVFGLDTDMKRLFAASITALNNIPDDFSATDTVMSNVLAVVISIELMIIMMIVAQNSAAAGAAAASGSH